MLYIKYKSNKKHNILLILESIFIVVFLFCLNLFLVKNIYKALNTDTYKYTMYLLFIIILTFDMSFLYVFHKIIYRSINQIYIIYKDQIISRKYNELVAKSINIKNINELTYCKFMKTIVSISLSDNKNTITIKGLTQNQYKEILDILKVRHED